MYLFSRTGRLAGGSSREAMAWAVTITERVNSVTGIGASLYARAYSPAFGTLVWSAFVEDLAHLEAAGDKLLADDTYADLTDRGAGFLDGGLDDLLAQVLSGAPDPNRPIEYVSAVQAVCANGRIAEGLAVGAELAQRAEKITGEPTLFLMNSTGPYGGVGWVSGYANVQAFEKAQQSLATDAAWLKFVDSKAGTAYAPDPALTTSTVFRRIA